jgi:hypothetical protein
MTSDRRTKVGTLSTRKIMTLKLSEVTTSMMMMKTIIICAIFQKSRIATGMMTCMISMKSTTNETTSHQAKTTKKNRERMTAPLDHLQTL